MRHWLWVVALAVVLGGCGGGGGSSDAVVASAASGSGGNTGGDDSDLPEDPLEKALITGNGQALDEQTLLEQALAEVARLALLQKRLVLNLGVEGALAYPVPQSSHFVNADYGSGVTLLLGSGSEQDQGVSLASAVSFDGIRAAGIGFKFYQSQAGEAGIQAFGSGVLKWLAGDRVPSGVALAGFASGDTSDLQGWLIDALPTATQQVCASGLSLSCLNGKQVLIVSDMPADADQLALEALVKTAAQSGVGVFYVHTRGWSSSDLGASLLAHFGMSLGAYPGNYFVQDSLEWASAESMLQAMQASNPMQVALQHFLNNDFPVNFAECESLAGGNCDNYAPLQSALLDAATTLRNSLASLDRHGLPLFDQPGRRLLKLLVLLGDHWRQDITYPMTKEVTPTDRFMKALFADYSVHYLRDQQPAQADLGSFSEPLLTVPATTSVSRSLTVQGDNFTALGVYILPGQTITVTRQDSSAARTAIRINTQRTGSTRLWDEYSRPRFLSSPSMAIESGETIAITSPYGGTLQLVHSQAPDAVMVKLSLSQVAQHPFLQYGPGMDEAAFAADLQNSALTWTEIRTPFAEVHSRRDFMLESIKGEKSRYAGDIDTFLSDLFEYVLKDAYTLAGFQGDGVSLPSRVANRCQTLNWDCTSSAIHALPKVQHINVDKFSHCGSGCSGNPYDQAWALDPYGWGESHELGHNLQRNLLKIHGGRSGEVSNNVFPLHKNWRLLQEKGEDRSADRIQYLEAFEILKAAAGAADPYQAAYNAIWSDGSYAADNGLRMAFYIQLAHLWNDVHGNGPGNGEGWDIITLLYLAERQFSHLSSSDWLSQRDRFGMGNFATKPDLNGNEFMLIVASYLAQRDLRPLWDQWGVDYGAETDAQLDALGLGAQAAVIWVGPDSNDWSAVQKVSVSAAMSWPF